MKTLQPFALLISLLFSQILFAGNPVKVHQFINHKDWSFVENKGQLAGQSEIKYYGHQGGVYLYCKPGMLSFVFTKTENSPEQISEATSQPSGFPLGKPVPTSSGGAGGFGPMKHQTSQPSKISSSRTGLVLLNSNPNAQIIASDQQEYYENYYTTGDADHGITNVHTFKTVTYKNIYANIDMVLNCREQGLEYSFIVHPGGKVSDIQLRWNGVDEAKTLANGGFKFSNSLGSLEESAPKSFVDGKLVQSSFIKKGLVHGFEISDYDKTKDLLIDPNLIWGTYFANQLSYSRAVCTDNAGNIYITGTFGGSVNIATTGTYQTIIGGYYDAYLAKFDPKDGLVWATYYGGSNDDEAYGISIDSSRSIYITGKTNSRNGIATSGAYQTTSSATQGFSGTPDTFVVFLAKFSSSGALNWGTYFSGNGGTYNTGLTDNYFRYGLGVSTDDSGNVYITGHTESFNGLASSGAYQTSYGGCYLAKFTSKGAISWATYYGNSIGDVALAISTDHLGNVYITGSTRDDSSNIATSGAYQTSYNGRVLGGPGFSNAFLAKFSQKGSLLWGTYYSGNSASGANAINIDIYGNIYITGYTVSSTGIATSGAYQTASKLSIDPDSSTAFLAKFTPKGSLSWATYYGGSAYNEGFGLSSDSAANVYVVGNTRSSSGIATYGAYLTSYIDRGGYYDYSAFLAKFNSVGALSWATYYGEPGPTEACGVSVDRSRNVYIAGYTQSDQGIATSGAFQTTYKTNLNDGSIDGFLAKFHFYDNDAGIDSFISPSGSACAGTQSVKVRLENYGIYALKSDSIYWTVNGKPQTPVKWTGALKNDSTAIVTLGTYNFSSNNNVIVAWSRKPNGIVDSVPENDSAKSDFTINNPAAAVISNAALCNGSAILIGAKAVAGSSYSWSSSVSGFSSTSSNPSVSPTSAASYTLVETNLKGCKDSNSVTITVNALPTISAAISDTAICSGDSISIGANAVKGSLYFWWAPDSVFVSQSSNPKVSPSSTTSYTVTETNSKGCMRSDTVSITVNALPAASVISKTTICSGYAISIGASPVSGSTYSWSGSITGFSSTSSNPSVSLTTNASYTLTETNSKGCSTSNSLNINILPIPTAKIISNTAICSGSSLNLLASAGSGISYIWTNSLSGGTTTVPNPSVSPTSTVSYTLTVTNAYGCIKSDSVTITVNKLPAASVISNTAICSGSSISVGGSPVAGSSYSWTGSASGFASTISNPSVSPTSATSYSLTETDSNGCVNSNSVAIAVNKLPVAAVISNTTICSGATISIGASAISGSDYSWTSSASGFSSTVSNPSVSPTATTQYKLSETNSKGCSGTDSVTITVNPLPKSNFSFTNICPGDSSPFIDSSTLAASYNWHFGDGGTSSLVSPKHLYTAIGNYNVSLKVTSNAGCTDSSSKSLSISSCVWPGDANGDKVVDMKDLLAIGVAYGTIGHPRPNASINWTGQPSPDWDSTFANGVNYKNADCKGDSIVNSADTLAVSANYSLSHSKSGGLNQGNISDPGFSIKYLKDTFYAGDTLIVQIILGGVAKPIVNLYGLTFSVGLDPSIFEMNRAFLKINPSFLGTNGTDLIAMTKNNSSAGTMDIGICRINQQNASGNGTIANLFVPVKPTLTQKYVKASLSLSNNYQISYNQKPVPLYLTSDTVLVKQDHTGIENSKTIEPISLSIYPNPFQSSTTIAYNLNHNSKINIVLIDITGKQIGTIINETQVPGDYQFDINAEKYHLSSGIYLMKFMMDDEVVSRRLVKF